MVSNSTFGSRFQYLMDSKKMSPADITRELSLGFTEPMISRWLSGDTKKPYRKTLQKISDYFKCSIEWLDKGVGEPFLDDNKSNSAPKGYISESLPWVEVPTQRKRTATEQEVPVSEMMYMTSVVLESNTVYRSALASNIRAFFQAVKGEEEMNDMRNEVNLMRQDIARLESLILQLSNGDQSEKKRAGNDH